MALASEYGQKLYTGVFYRNPSPPPTYEAEVRRRQEETRSDARPRERILDLFRAQ
jgi:2-oxoglutarate ferredoxin oxidoreductase subunit beta